MMPRVSAIIKILHDPYQGMPPEVLEQAAERGHRLHWLCLSYLASLDGLCDKPTEILAEDVAPYAAFAEWTTMHQVSPILVETPEEQATYGYRGTPDALVRYGARKVETLIDLKFTAAVLPTHRVQLQAYWRLPSYGMAKQARLIHIDPTSGVLQDIRIYPNDQDWAAFVGALHVHSWRIAKGKAKP